MELAAWPGTAAPGVAGGQWRGHAGPGHPSGLCQALGRFAPHKWGLGSPGPPPPGGPNSPLLCSERGLSGARPSSYPHQLPLFDDLGSMRLHQRAGGTPSPPVALSQPARQWAGSTLGVGLGWGDGLQVWQTPQGWRGSGCWVWCWPGARASWGWRAGACGHLQGRSQSGHGSQTRAPARPRAAQGSEPAPPELQVFRPPGAATGIRWHGDLGGRGEQVIAQGPGKPCKPRKELVRHRPPLPPRNRGVGSPPAELQ